MLLESDSDVKRTQSLSFPNPGLAKRKLRRPFGTTLDSVWEKALLERQWHDMVRVRLCMI